MSDQPARPQQPFSAFGQARHRSEGPQAGRDELAAIPAENQGVGRPPYRLRLNSRTVVELRPDLYAVDELRGP